MSAEYAIALFGIFAGLCAIVALIWALKNRLLKTEDGAMYEAVADDEPDYTETCQSNANHASRRSRWLFLIAFTTLSALIGWLIIETVHVAGQPPAVTPAARTQPDTD